MSNLEVTYSNSRGFESSSESQNRIRPHETQGPREIGHKGKHVEGHLLCCGIKCYYFIMDDKQWSGCKQTCQDCSFSLLKIENEDELVP
ncbi:hypothetical protein STEG23_008266 [Scotinomys teguina]